LNQEGVNPLELFQVWLNLPKAKKFVKPHFKMLWSEDIPIFNFLDETGKCVDINVIAGKIGEVFPPLPAPDSWAADSNNEVAVWTIKMEAGAKWAIPATIQKVNRTLYFYKGSSIIIDDNEILAYKSIELISDSETIIINGNADGYFLMLQGKPISEPVVQYGPFVMNSETEIQEAFNDFRRTEFGGWPWPRRDQVHPREKGRFAKYADGTEESR
jgi:redox-sensitive bicupin YhaK (pirin superfamily)